MDSSRLRLGCGVHSLRAARPLDLQSIVAGREGSEPFHMHIAEQPREVEDCEQYLGKRPVAWLLDNLPVNQNFHLVHATHMDSTETRDLAASGATVVLCPSTEGNLGDGFFPLKDYLTAGGSFAIGTDSHIGLCPFEELRWLEYGARLQSGERNIASTPTELESAFVLWRNSLLGGALAGGEWTDARAPAEAALEPGNMLDVIVLNAPLLAASAPEERLATAIYSGDASWIRNTIVGGSIRVADGRHVDAAAIAAEFKPVAARLRKPPA